MLKTTARKQGNFSKHPGLPGKSLNEMARELREPEGWRAINEKLKALTTIKNDLERRLAELKPSYRRYSAISKQLATINQEIENTMTGLRAAVNCNKWSD